MAFIKKGKFNMIECEYRCIKHKGNPAHFKILIKGESVSLNICSTCLETYFHPNEYEILEDYTPRIEIQSHPSKTILYNKDYSKLKAKLERITQKKE